MLTTLLSLVTALRVAAAPVPVGPAQYACVRVNITDLVTTQTGLSAYAIQQSVISQLQSSGWSATAVDGGVAGWDCNAPILFSVSGAATWTTGDAGDTTFSFVVVASAYEKMDSKWKANYWWWAEHHDRFGVFTSYPTQASGGQQFMMATTAFITTIRQEVEVD